MKLKKFSATLIIQAYSHKEALQAINKIENDHPNISLDVLEESHEHH